MSSAAPRRARVPQGSVLGAALLVGACGGAPALTPGEVVPHRDEELPPAGPAVDTQTGFGVLGEAEGDAEVRALVLRFVAALASENGTQVAQLLAKAAWSSGGRGTPAEELGRRLSMYDYQVLRAPLARGELERMQVRSAATGEWDVRLPALSLPEPLFTGRPVLRIAKDAAGLTITHYGEE